MAVALPHSSLPRIGDASMNNLIDKIERSLNRLEAHPFANMKVLASVTFVAAGTPQRVYHGLGYAATGFVVINNDSNSVISQGSADTDPSNFILLKSSGVLSSVTLAIF